MVFLGLEKKVKFYPKLRGHFTYDSAPVSDSKIHYFWRSQHTPIDLFEGSKQHKI